MLTSIALYWILETLMTTGYLPHRLSLVGVHLNSRRTTVEGPATVNVVVPELHAAPMHIMAPGMLLRSTSVCVPDAVKPVHEYLVTASTPGAAITKSDWRL